MDKELEDLKETVRLQGLQIITLERCIKAQIQNNKILDRRIRFFENKFEKKR